jgi:predicted nucleic acid-binding protein
VTIVVDASVVVAALIDAGPEGIWARPLLAHEDIVAPHLMPVEVGEVLRRAAAAGKVSSDVATIAHADLLRLRVTLVPYAALAERVWQLRGGVSAYDACYVALAEQLDAPFATLDTRLTRAQGPECAFWTPQGSP